MAYGDGRPTGSWIRRSRDGHIAGIESWSASDKGRLRGARTRGRRPAVPLGFLNILRAGWLSVAAVSPGFREYLQAEETDVWQWYTSHKNRDEQAEAIRFELLKWTYRLDPDLQPAIYETAQEVARALGLDIPLTIYQAQNPQGLNASLAFCPRRGTHHPAWSRESETDGGRVPGAARS